MTNNKDSKSLRTLTYVISAFGFLFAIIGLSEFYNVKIAGQGSAYAFGPINENQWYYQNVSVYASYNLTSGLLFLVASSFTVWATINKKEISALFGICLIILFFLAELISSKVQ